MLKSSEGVQAEPQRILIVRLSALGDVVLSSGLLPALRARWPQARLSWLVEAPAAPLLREHPLLDELIVAPRAEWKRLLKARQYLALWRSLREFRKALRARRFDLVVDPQGLLKSALLGWFSGAPRRVLLKPREGSHWLATEYLREPKAGDEAIGHEYRALAVHLGAGPAQFQLSLQPNAQAVALADARLSEQPWRDRVAVLAAFTTRPQKHWFDQEWRALAQRLQKAGLQPVLLGGPADRAAAESLCAGAPGLLNWVGELPLDVSAALIGRAALLVGVDTGLTHMAMAQRRPSVALFGSTVPYRQGPGPEARVLYRALPCSPCHRQPSCNARFDCMRQYHADEVADIALALWQAHRPPSP